MKLTEEKILAIPQERGLSVKINSIENLIFDTELLQIETDSDILGLYLEFQSMINNSNSFELKEFNTNGIAENLLKELEFTEINLNKDNFSKIKVPSKFYSILRKIPLLHFLLEEEKEEFVKKENDTKVLLVKIDKIEENLNLEKKELFSFISYLEEREKFILNNLKKAEEVLLIYFTKLEIMKNEIEEEYKKETKENQSFDRVELINKKKKKRLIENFEEQLFSMRTSLELLFNEVLLINSTKEETSKTFFSIDNALSTTVPRLRNNLVLLMTNKKNKGTRDGINKINGFMNYTMQQAAITTKEIAKETKSMEITDVISIETLNVYARESLEIVDIYKNDRTISNTKREEKFISLKERNDEFKRNMINDSSRLISY